MSLPSTQGGFGAADPVNLRQAQRVLEQARVLGTLRDDQHIARKILLGDIPGLLTGAMYTPDAQALALADGVVHQTVVFAERATIHIFDDPRLGR